MTGAKGAHAKMGRGRAKAWGPRRPARSVAVIFSIAGFVFNLVMLGMIVEYARGRLRHWEARPRWPRWLFGFLCCFVALRLFALLLRVEQ